MRVWTAVIVLIGLIGLSAANASAAIPRSDFIDQADSICARFQPRMQSHVDQISYSVGYQDLARNVEQFKRLVKHELGQIRQLPDPATGRHRLSRWFKRNHVTLGRMQDIADVARSTGDDDQIYAAINRFTESANVKKHAARRFGFRTCR